MNVVDLRIGRDEAISQTKTKRLSNDPNRPLCYRLIPEKSWTWSQKQALYRKMTKLLEDLTTESPNVPEVLSKLTEDKDALLMFKTEGYKNIVYKLLGKGREANVELLLEATNVTLDSKV